MLARQVKRMNSIMSGSSQLMGETAKELSILQQAYVYVVRLLLDAGASLNSPDDPHGDAYKQRLLQDVSPAVREEVGTWM